MVTTAQEGQEMGTTARGPQPITYGMPGDFARFIESVTKLFEREPDWSWRDEEARNAAGTMRDLITRRLDGERGQVTAT